MSPIQTIAFLHPGNMGASLALALSHRSPHLTLLTNLSGRSSETIARSESANLVDTSLPDLIARSDLIFSILPPSSALPLAKEIVDNLSSRPSGAGRLCYLDANAVSPGTMKDIADVLEPHGIAVIDGSVLGGPAKEGYDPAIYLSSHERWAGELKEVAEVLKGGLKVEVLEGAGEGAASALKMCYGGINKGYTGLAAMLVLAANAHSPGTAQALMKELSLSQNLALDRFSKSIPDMVPKAYRFVGEMQEISSFLTASLSSVQGSSPTDAQAVAQTYEGLAQAFQRIADDLKLASGSTGASPANANEAGDRGRAGEVPALLDWARAGGVMAKEGKESKS